MISEYGPSLDLGEVWGKYALLQFRCIKRENSFNFLFSKNDLVALARLAVYRSNGEELGKEQECLLVLSADLLYLGEASSQASVSVQHPSCVLPSFSEAAHDPPGKQQENQLTMSCSHSPAFFLSLYA